MAEVKGKQRKGERTGKIRDIKYMMDASCEGETGEAMAVANVCKSF